MVRNALLAVSALTALIGLACSGGEDGDDGRIRVLASNGIVADWISNVAGESARVDALVPPGADPHSFQLSPSDVRAIGDADIVFLVGASLEANFEGDIRENASGPVIQLAEGLELREPDEGGHEAGEDAADGHSDGPLDPHIWMDADLAIAAVERIAGELAVVDPVNAQAYAANAQAYAGEIRTMDSRVMATLADLPAERKLLVTFHDAYGYFAERYGLTILGFVVENPDEEPSAAAIAELIDDMREAGANVIYVEPQFNARVVEQVAAETGAEVRTIPSDALTDDYPTYIDLILTIAEEIAR